MEHTFENSTAINSDCMEIMKQYPDKFFKLALVDPPYFSGPEKRRYYGSKFSRKGVKRTEYPITEKWIVPGSELFDEIKRVSVNQIIWGCNYYNYVFGPGRIIWDKVNYKSSYSDAEIAFCSLIDSVRIFRFMWNGMMQGKSITEGHIMQGDKSKNEIKIHPTQKPVLLYKWLLLNYAKSGDNILDTHLGSASSRIAAFDMGYSFTGVELNQEHFNRSVTRFKNHISQTKLIFPEPEPESLTCSCHD